MLGEIVVNNQRVHAVIHEPFAHRGARERRQVLVRCRVRSGRGNDRRIRHRPFFFENGEGASDVGILLSNRNVDAIERTMIFQPALFGRLVQARLADDRVERDHGLAGGPIADDQFALAATDRDHRVDRHNTSLDRLAHTFAFDNAGRNFFERIRLVGFHRPLPIQWLAECVHHAAEQAFADWNLKQLAGRLRFIAFHDLGCVAEQNGAHLRLFEVERETEHAARKLDHLVQHHVAEPFDAGDAVTGFADNADVGFAGRGLETRDLRFDFFEDAAHNK